MGSRKLSRGRPQKRARPPPKKTLSTVSTQTDNPPETGFGQLKWRVEDSCFGEVLRAPDGHTLLPPGLFEEVSEHVAQLSTCKSADG